MYAQYYRHTMLYSRSRHPRSITIVTAHCHRLIVEPISSMSTMQYHTDVYDTDGDDEEEEDDEDDYDDVDDFDDDDGCDVDDDDDGDDDDDDDGDN